MQTIGERLEEARKHKGVSLREAAEATKIRSDYLQKLETNKFDLGLSPIYLRGFLRGYAHYLGLSPDKLVNDFDDLDPASSRPGRSVNREVYGRMEFGSAAEAPARAETSTPAAEAAHKPAGHKPAPRPAPRPSSKNLGQFPIGDAPSDRAMVLYFLKLGGLIALAIAIPVWGLLWALSGKPKPTPTAPVVQTPPAPAAPLPPAGKPTVITALDEVQLQVWEKIDDTINSGYGVVLLPPTTLKRGEVRTMPKAGPIIIGSSNLKKIQADSATRSYKLAEEKTVKDGNQYVVLP
ncbi:MAG: helix-turn-helix domain-containing protein [Verrucomicrobiota bacterium]